MTTPAGDEAARLSCPNCGYDLRGGFTAAGETSAECPECGARWLLMQLTGELRPLEQARPLGALGVAASLSPSLIAVIALSVAILLPDVGGPRLLLIAAPIMMPILLAVIGAWRYSRFRSRRRLLRVVGFVVVFLLVNCVLFLILAAAAVLLIASIDPEHFMV